MIDLKEFKLKVLLKEYTDEEVLSTLHDLYSTVQAYNPESRNYTIMVMVNDICAILRNKHLFENKSIKKVFILKKRIIDQNYFNLCRNLVLSKNYLVLDNYSFDRFFSKSYNSQNQNYNRGLSLNISNLNDVRKNILFNTLTHFYYKQDPLEKTITHILQRDNSDHSYELELDIDTVRVKNSNVEIIEEKIEVLEQNGVSLFSIYRFLSIFKQDPFLNVFLANSESGSLEKKERLKADLYKYKFLKFIKKQKSVVVTADSSRFKKNVDSFKEIYNNLPTSIRPAFLTFYDLYYEHNQAKDIFKAAFLSFSNDNIEEEKSEFEEEFGNELGVIQILPYNLTRQPTENEMIQEERDLIQQRNYSSFFPPQRRTLI